MTLIAYDGSDDAKSAIEHAAGLMPVAQRRNEKRRTLHEASDWSRSRVRHNHPP
jgi:hypothetical protein